LLDGTYTYYLWTVKIEKSAKIYNIEHEMYIECILNVLGTYYTTVLQYRVVNRVYRQGSYNINCFLFIAPEY